MTTYQGAMGLYEPQPISLITVDDVLVDIMFAVSKWVSPHPTVGGLDPYAPVITFPSRLPIIDSMFNRSLRVEAYQIKQCSTITSVMRCLSRIPRGDMGETRDNDIVILGILETARRVLHGERSKILCHSSDDRLWVYIERVSSGYGIKITVLLVRGRGKSELVTAINNASLVFHQPS